MTYCLGIKTEAGLVMASDSRTNAGLDQVNVCRKMHTFVRPGEHVFVLLSSGGLALTQSVLALLRDEYDAGRGLAAATSMYSAARAVGEQVRKIAELDRAALERDQIPFNVHFLLGGQIKGGEHDLYLIYPQGNPLAATRDCPFLQVGETKYGRPILDRGVRYDQTTLEEAAKYALISLDSCMRSNLTVGPPIDLAVYGAGDLSLRHECRFAAGDPQLVTIRTQWEQALRQAVQKLPAVNLTAR
jgi:putative proteasome-type protease